MEKRNVPEWDEYFMKIAELARSKSKDRSTQVGAVIVGNGHAILSMGYNGFPRGVNDDVDSRYERPDKLLFTEHAERNAIFSALGSTIYVTGGGVPCADCSRAVIQAGITTVIGMNHTFEGKGPWADSCLAGKTMLQEAGVKIVLLDVNYRRVIHE